ncbi:hypothetical protein AB0M34_19260, partial [Nocardia sp. NPDC050193]
MDGARGSRRPRQPEPPANPGPLTVQDLVDRVDSERTVRRRVAFTAMVCGVIKAAPRPCTARAAIRVSISPASPH